MNPLGVYSLHPYCQMCVYYTAQNSEMFLAPMRFKLMDYRIISRLELNLQGFVKAWLVSTKYPQIMKQKWFRDEEFIWIKPEDLIESEP